MKQLVPFVLTPRVNALLCCSAAVLLSACGGASTDAGDHQPAQSAAYLYASGTSKTDAAPVAPVDAAATTSDGPTALLASATVVPAVAASTYNLYVSTTGSDSNAGTQAAPFRTINKAASVAKPSTTVHVAAGTYNGNVSTSVSGTAAARIVYVSDVKWGAKIIGTGTLAMWTNNGNYTDIIGFDITGPGRLGILNYSSYVLMASNHVHNLTISGGCNGDGGAGIVNANYSSSDDDIIGNVVHDIGAPGACNGVQGIYSSNLRGHIYNNIVYRVSAWGIHLWHAANNVMIANNTVFANGSSSMGGGIEIGSGDSPGGIVVDNTKVINNIVYANPGASITEYCYSGVACIGKNNTVANNLVYGNGQGISMKVGAATGTIATDPQFANYQANGSGDYRVKSTSPAIDKGVATSAPAYDIDNVARPSGAAFDIGAYEYVGTVTAPGSNLYVATTGSDTNSGTQSAPFLTINKAASVAKPSTVVHVAAGTYSGNVTTTTSGTATARIRYVSDTKWGAKIVGSGTAAMWTNNGNYVDITGFDITGPGRFGIMNNASFALMSNNHVHNLTISGGCNGNSGAGIVNAVTSSTDDDIIGNLVHDIGTPGACNVIHGINSTNLRSRIYNNVIYRASAWGIQLWNASNNVMIANNTVFANGTATMGGGMLLGAGDSPGGIVLDNSKVINNIVYANPGASIVEYCYAGVNCIGANNTVANNLVYGNGQVTSLKVGVATGTIAADPKFVSYAPTTTTGNYRLQSISPAVDKGVAASAPAYDIDNIARPKGAALDIGAYESF